MGVTQGGVVSPILFNHYMSMLPTPSPGIKLITYADECTIASSSVNVDEITNRINEYLIPNIPNSGILSESFCTKQCAEKRCQYSNSGT